MTRYTQNDYLYRRLGPWPQPSPDHPHGKAPAVVHIPPSEQRRWNRRIGRRYVIDLLTRWPKAAWLSITRPTYDDLSNEGFEALLTEGIYTRFLCPTLDPIDEERFAPLLAEAGDDTVFFKMDFSPIADVKPLPGMYVAASVVLVRRDGDGPLKVVGIWINDLLLRPSDPAYHRAKYFVMQGAAYGILFTVHPNLHFPFDSVNAITKTAVPVRHPLFRLLEPHLDYQLALNNAVLNMPGTVIAENPKVPYAPFTARATDGLMAFFTAGYAGIEGNSAYPPYDYVERPHRTEGLYSAFLDAYYPPFLAFAKKVCQHIDRGDPIVVDWARYIRQWIPGFGGVRKAERCRDLDFDIFDRPDRLPEVLAGFLWDVTVAHATDHQTFGHDIGVYQHCLRLRVPPPSSPTDTCAQGDLVWRRDLFRAHLAEMMFFIPRTLQSLMTVEYRFEQPELCEAARQFKEDLRAVEASLDAKGIPHYMGLYEFSASIQY
jgi:hypothetical protein